MNVNIIITEEQKKVLIKESIKSKVEDIIKKNYEFTSKIFKETFCPYLTQAIFVALCQTSCVPCTACICTWHAAPQDS